MALLLDNLPSQCRAEMGPVLERIEQQLNPSGIWLFGSWARGSQSRHSDIDILIAGLADHQVVEAYGLALEAIGDTPLPIQPLVASPELLVRHADSPFWRSVRAEARPLMEGSKFP